MGEAIGKGWSTLEASFVLARAYIERVDPAKAKQLASAAKQFNSEKLGLAAREAYAVASSTDTSTQKANRFAGIAGSLAGGVMGAKVGAMIGALGGPIGSAVLGVIGGAVGTFAGDKLFSAVSRRVLDRKPDESPANVAAVAKAKALVPDAAGVGARSGPRIEQQNTFAPVFHVKIEASDADMANKFLAQVSPMLTRDGRASTQSEQPHGDVRCAAYVKEETMDVIRQITGAATQAGIATERVRQMVRIFDRNRAASMSTVDVLQRLATGNLSSGAELLTGASGAIALAGDLFPQVGTVLRSFNAAQASVGSILTAIDGSNFPLVRAAADSVKSALGGAWNQFNAAVGIKDSAVLDVIKSTGVGSMLSGLVDGATSSTPHMMSMTSEAGDAFHFNLSTAAYDTR